MKILIIYWNSGSNVKLKGIHDHLYALEKNFPENSYYYWDGYFGIPKWLKGGVFDSVILHTTFLCLREVLSTPELFERTRTIRDMSCYKIAIPQDEYDLPMILDEWFEFMGINTVLTNLPQFTDMLYPRMKSKAQFKKVLTGYVSNSLLEFSRCAIHEHKWDIGYRGARLPYWFGSLGQLKYQLGTDVADRLQQLGLSVNCSNEEKDFIAGRDWYSFLCSCGAVLGSESGSSLVINDKSLKSDVQQYLVNNPQASFEDVNQSVFMGEDDRYHMSAVSPRHFECAALKVCQLLVEGEYDGIMKAGVHYVSINQDFSNLEEVVAKVKDVDYCAEIAENAYRDIACNSKYSYRNFAQIIVDSVSEHAFPAGEKKACWDMKFTLFSMVSYIMNIFRVEFIKRLLGKFVRFLSPKLYLILRG